MDLTPHPLSLWKPSTRSPLSQYEIGPFKNLVYLIIDWKQKIALWVDPQEDLSEPLKDLKSFGIRLTGVLLTHTHPDHTAGLTPLLKLDPTTPVYLHPLEAHRLKQRVPEKSLRFLNSGDSLVLGDLGIDVIHTPGHSAGSLSYRIEDYLLTGDTLFIQDCGRTDLSTGSTQEMFHTLQLYRAMNPQLKIFPGHHYHPKFWSTLEDEIRSSPPFQCRSIQELEALP